MSSATEAHEGLSGLSFKADFVQRAKELTSFVSDQSQENETLGHLNPETIGRLSDTGLLRFMVPAFVNGGGANLVESLLVLEEISAADGSAGWVTMAACVATGAAAAYLPDAGVRSLFNSPAPPLLAGQGAPNGKAIKEGNGYRLSGNWSYGSGIKHASHAFTGAFIFENGQICRNGKGQPLSRVFVVPIDKVALENNWDVIGLRATGSVDYSITNAFVPEEHTFSLNTMHSRHDAPLYRVGIIGLAGITHTAFALGIAKRALLEIEHISLQKGGPDGKLCDRDSFRETFSFATAQYLAARAYALETYERLENHIANKGIVSIRETTLLRLALNFITTTAYDVCLFAYKAGGGTSLRNGPLQRAYRDISAGAQHFQVSVPILRECGKELLGLATNHTWATTGLIEQ